MRPSTVVHLLVLATQSVILPGFATALRCLQCDTFYNPSCGFSQNISSTSVSIGECSNIEDSCYTAEMGAHTKRITRGCYDPSISFCGEIKCSRCFTDECNNSQFIEEKCISCTSNSEDNSCERNVESNYEPEVCPETTFERSGCFLHIKDNIYTRGCVANLDEEMFEECQQGDVCKICSADRCNSRDEFLSCYTCDSERDTNCVHRPRGQYIEQCDSYSDHCVVFAIPDGKTVRGCSSEIEYSDATFCPSTNCLECDTDECNSQLIPRNRRICYQCDARNYGCMDGTSSQSYERACNIFQYGDRCFTYVDETGFGYRGCMSDQSAASAICANEPEKCTICNENSCNSDFIEHDSELFCYHCSEDEEACPWRQRIPEQTTTCQTKVTQETIDSCYYFKFADGKVRRGCTLDDAEFCAEHECQMCSGNYCNSQVAEPQTCIQCNSTDELHPTCEEDARDLISLSCEEEAYYDDRGCYSLKVEEVVIRGCWNAVDADHKALCEAADNTGHRCNRCFGNGCNTHDHSASVRPLVSIPVVVLSAVLVARVLLSERIRMPLNWRIN